jgi:hypothetical protein
MQKIHWIIRLFIQKPIQLWKNKDLKVTVNDLIANKEKNSLNKTITYYLQK